MNMAKKNNNNNNNMRIMCADAGLSLTPHVQVIFVSAAVINAGDKKNEYMTNQAPVDIWSTCTLLTVKFFQRIK